MKKGFSRSIFLIALGSLCGVFCVSAGEENTDELQAANETQYVELLITLCDPLRRLENKPPLDLALVPEGWKQHRKAILDGLVAQFDDTAPVMAPGSKEATLHNEIYRFRKCDYAYYIFATLTEQELEDFGTGMSPSTPERRDQRLRELKEWWILHRSEWIE